ncbi:hypothetical protein SAY87_012379 [Trapa incisa]|uniref:Uncharacterized protein n=1 Tax=Trapa incisa TaxID=236973 RepID=A0AAN7H117_9MYRT|nr:hypothetical protein SAY87_012379 [Trapa incisa]
MQILEFIWWWPHWVLPELHASSYQVTSNGCLNDDGCPVLFGEGSGGWPGEPSNLHCRLCRRHYNGMPLLVRYDGVYPYTRRRLWLRLCLDKAGAQLAEQPPPFLSLLQIGTSKTVRDFVQEMINDGPRKRRTACGAVKFKSFKITGERDAED